MKLEDFKKELISHLEKMDEEYGVTEKETKKTAAKIAAATSASAAYRILCKESNCEDADIAIDMLLTIFVKE